MENENDTKIEEETKDDIEEVIEEPKSDIIPDVNIPTIQAVGKDKESVTKDVPVLNKNHALAVKSRVQEMLKRLPGQHPKRPLQYYK